MSQKIFICLIVSILSTAGMGCNSSQSTTQPIISTESEAVEENTDEMPRYFAEDFYAADNGDQLPINVVASELLDFIIPNTFNDISERADIIVVGRPSESLEESDTSTTASNPRQEFSISDFEIEVSIKGDFQSGDVIGLGQYVAIVADKAYALPENHRRWNERTLVVGSMSNYRPVRKNATYVLFLYERSDVGGNVYFPVYESFGRVNIDDTDKLDDLGWVTLTQETMRESAIALYQNVPEDSTE